MKKTVSEVANWVARNAPLVVTLIAIMGTMILAFYKDADVNSLLPTLVGLYLGQKTSTSISAHFAASKDPNCDTREVIKDTEGLK